MAQLFANNVFSSLASALSDVAVALIVASGQGSRFPAPSGGDHFLLTLVAIDANGTETGWEIVKCTARSGDGMTLQRAQEGTTARNWPAGTRVEMRLTAGSMAATGSTDALLPSSQTLTRNAAGQITQIGEVIAGATVTTTIAYNAQGNVVTVTRVSGGHTRTETYTYDAAGNITGMSATET